MEGLTASNESLGTLTEEKVEAAGVLVDRGGYGMLVELDTPRFVKRGNNDTILIQLADRLTPASEVDICYRLVPFADKPPKLGEMPMAVAETQDHKVVQHATVWRGSCLEVFGSMPGSAEIGQVLLVPKAGDSPAAAYRAEGAIQVATSDVQVSSSEREDGYELQALIPLALLKLDPQKDQWLLEFQVSSERGKQRTHHTLFGSQRAYENNVRYGLFEVSQ